jgi:hypothetical protein
LDTAISGKGNAPSGCLKACRIRPGVTDLRRLPATRKNSARFLSLVMPVMAPRGAFSALGGKALTSPGPATRQYPTAADSGHTGAEAMAALADEFARLIGALHGGALRTTLLQGIGALYRRAPGPESISAGPD